MNPWLAFVLGAFSVWRITHLLHAEDGPWDLLYRLRQWLGRSFFGQLTDCFYCLSLWVSAPFAWMLGAGWLEKLLFFWALSGAAIILQKISAPAGDSIPPNSYQEDEP